ncbi:MAG: CdaR family protein [Bacteroidales bacterium]
MDKKKNIVLVLKRKFRSRNVLIFIFFVIISTILWFLNALNKTYVTDFNLNISFINIPENLIQKNISKTFIIKVKGTGFSLIREKFNNLDIPINIDLNNKNIKIFSLENSSEKYILTRDIVPLISKLFSDEVSIGKIIPDTIFFVDKRCISKTVPIKANLVFPENDISNFISEIIISPKKITIYGEKGIIDTINYLYTQPREVILTSLNNYFELPILDKFEGKINFSIKKVIVNVKVKEFTEKKLLVKITPENFPEEFDVILSPNEVNIVCKIPLSDYENIKSEDFHAFVDYQIRGKDMIQVKVESKNTKARVTQINPEFINYILQKKNHD